MDIQGKLLVVKQSQQITEKFVKREFVVRTEEQYPQEIQFELTNDKCGLVDTFAIDESIKVYFNLQGRAWVNPQGETKYFNKLVCWRIDKVGETSQQPQQAPQQQPYQQAQPQYQSQPTETASDDDLPF